MRGWKDGIQSTYGRHERVTVMMDKALFDAYVLVSISQLMYPLHSFSFCCAN